MFASKSTLDRSRKLLHALHDGFCVVLNFIYLNLLFYVVQWMPVKAK